MGGARLAFVFFSVFAAGLFVGVAIASMLKPADTLASQWETIARKSLATAERSNAALEQSNNTTRDCVNSLTRTTNNLELANSTIASLLKELGR